VAVELEASLAELLLEPGESWYERLARGLVERVASTDLTQLSIDDLNRLPFRFDWFLVLPDDGHQAMTMTGGLWARESPDVFALDGDEELTAALNAAAEQVNAEIARRTSPREREDLRSWSQAVTARFARERLLRGRLAPRDAVVPAFLLVRSRNREQRPQSRARTACGSRGPPSRSSDDDDPEPARRALGPAGARPDLVTARRWEAAAA
jgi:hypothetical protein